MTAARKNEYMADLYRQRKKRDNASRIVSALYVMLIAILCFVLIKLGASIQTVCIVLLAVGTAALVCGLIRGRKNRRLRKRMETVAICTLTIVTGLGLMSDFSNSTAKADFEAIEAVRAEEAYMAERNTDAEWIARAWDGFGFYYGDRELEAFTDLVLNRVDRHIYGATTIEAVITQPQQWQNWSADRRASDGTYDKVCEILAQRENGAPRTLPIDYLYFYTDFDGIYFLTNIGGEPMKIGG